MRRIFIAINLPGEIKQEIVELQKKLKKFDWPVRWSVIDNFHLTLRFIGSMTDQEVEELKNIVEPSVKGISPFTLNLNGFIVLPSFEAPRVIGLSLKDNEALFSLQNKIAGPVEEQGIGEPERFSFNGHITIGRLEPVKVNFRALTQLQFKGSFEVRSVEIMESVLKPEGPVYSTVESFQLK